MNFGITANPNLEESLPRVQRAAPSRWERLLSGVLTLLTVITIIGACVWLWQAELGFWATLAALFLSVVLVVRVRTSWRNIAVYVFGVMVIISAVDYLGWRFRLMNMDGWWIAIPLFIAEFFGALHVIGLQYTLWPRKADPLEAQVNPFRMPVFILIPTVNEGVDILRRTIGGALAARDKFLMEHPEGQVAIVVCNDGYVAGYENWREVEQLADRMGVLCVTRTVKGGAKAGNLENARQLLRAVGDSLIVIFDADQVPHADFLVKTVPPFTDTNIGWVQTGQYYGNLDNAVSAWAQDQQALFYKLLCPAKAAINACFICGTNVVIRASALDEIGGLPQTSVTEDYAASIELHPRWRSVFIEDKLAIGIGPMDLKSYFKQQRRWAIGTLSVLRSHWARIFLPRRNGLSIDQRVQYALASTHYLSGLRDMVYVVAPILFLITGIPAVVGSNIEQFLTHFMPYFLASQLAFWAAAYRKTGLRGIIIGFASFPILVSALFTVITGRRVGFNVTSKKQLNESNLRQVYPHLFFLALSIIALAVGLVTNRDSAALAITVLWTLYQIAMLSAAVWLAIADQANRSRTVQSFEEGVAAMGNAIVNMRKPVRIALAGLTTVAVGAAIILPKIHVPAAQFTPVLNQYEVYFGIKLPVALVNDRPQEIRDSIGVAPAIIGHTQEINDSFEMAWATQAHTNGAQPWITLLFSQPGVEPYFASLPSIANGVHDDALRRWARDIATYGEPVYLSVLPHLDRNWALSSAVVNGGIPADAPRAWQHIQAVFNEEGANNVAWVWSPADPINDDQYAPPADTIDVVLMSLIRYPDVEWQNPYAELRALSDAHPNKPLFIEVSAEGDPTRKALYLNLLGLAVADTPNAYALIYYEGSPRPDAEFADHDSWSMLSDPLSTYIVQQMVDDLSELTPQDAARRGMPRVSIYINDDANSATSAGE